MYQQYFGLATEPFGVSPDTRFFFPSEQHAEATAALYYAVTQRRGFAILVGRPGLGKTSVLVNLANRISAEARVAFLVHPHLVGDKVLESVLLAMGMEPDADPVRRLRQFHAFLLQLSREGKTCVVIIDEAQNLGFKALEAIRMLSNFEAPSHKLIQFILAGQPALESLLRTPEAEQILQRISVMARLEPLNVNQSHAYITHRLAIAGRRKPLFSAEAVKELTRASEGIPRNINTLCFNALTLAFSEAKELVDAKCVLQVERERSGEVSVRSEQLPAPLLPISAPPRHNHFAAYFTAALAIMTLGCIGVMYGVK
jgi:general secretion pathway protein A